MKPPASYGNGPDPFPEFFVTHPRACLYDLLLDRLDKRLLVGILSKNRGDRRKTARYLEMEDAVLQEELLRHQLLVSKKHTET